MVGPSTRYYRRVIRPYLDAHTLRDYVVHIKSLHVADLPVLYQLSRVMLCPAQGQYCSLSMLEAMTAGLPVIVPTGTAQAEMAGQAALTVDDTPQRWAEAIARLTQDSGLRVQQAARGRECVAHFTRNGTAQALMNCYEAVTDE